ncbi:hypothetical protein VNO80_34425 [Phaseolus coccineus]|uniref:Uncharacterized protein n=1 Tax=Phaseolus coccineus TaxID=3886 RepID=A0AAN9Q5I8_PHACN
MPLTRTLHRRSGSVGGATHRGIPTNQLPCALRVYSPVDSHTCQTPWSVFQDGPNGSPQADARSAHVPRHAMRRALAVHNRNDDVSPRAFQQPRAWATACNPRRSMSRVDRTDRLTPFHIRPGHIAGPHPLPSRQFQALFDSLSQSPFHLSLAVLVRYRSLRLYLALDGIYRPIGAAFPKQPDSPTAPRGATGSGHNGALTLSGAPLPGDLGPGPPLRTLLQTTIRTPKATDSHGGLFPVRSPLLGRILVSFFSLRLLICLNSAGSPA